MSKCCLKQRPIKSFLCIESSTDHYSLLDEEPLPQHDELAYQYANDASPICTLMESKQTLARYCPKSILLSSSRRFSSFGMCRMQFKISCLCLIKTCWKQLTVTYVYGEISDTSRLSQEISYLVQNLLSREKKL